MQITGIIAEYNPFHNGHAYQIDQCRKMGADYIIVVMSGNYVQRGEPAILDKYSRARIALEHGADLVLELPVGYSVSSAQTFAYTGVNLLHQLGCVTHLCFGCENPDKIKELAFPIYQIFEQENNFAHFIQKHLKNGHNYAKSRLKAALEYSGWAVEKQKNYEAILSKPNNILALSYEIALLQMQSRMKPIPIQRLGAAYHDAALATPSSATSTQMQHTNITIQDIRTHNDTSTNTQSPIQNIPILPSATGIRKILLEMNHFDSACLQPFLPPAALNVMQDIYQTYFPVEMQDFSPALLMCLLQFTEEQACNILDMSPSLWNRIKNNLTDYTDYLSFIDTCQSRTFPYSRIRRALLHALLNIQTAKQQQWIKQGIHFYIRPLGFRRQRAELLSCIKKNSSLPILSKLADYKTTLAETPEGIQMIEEEYRCDTLYRLISQAKFGHIQPDSFSRELILL